MERLTNNIKLGFQDSSKLPSYAGLWDRLKSYENIGLEPEDIEQAIIFAKEYILEVLKENKEAIATINAMGAGADAYEVEESSAELERLLIKFGGQQEDKK